MRKKSSFKYLSLLMSLLLIVGSMPFAAVASYTAPSWYTETQSITYSIDSAQKLKDVSDIVNNGVDTFAGKFINLTSDITLSTFTPIGNSTYSFEGTFNGDGHTVSGLSASGEYSGLFGKTYNAEIKNVTISGTVSNATKNGGIAVGYASFTTFTGVKTTGTVSGTTKIGGIAGSALNCTFLRCDNGASVTSASDSGNYAGGIAGYLVRSEVTNCVNNGAVSAYSYAGGIGGYVVGNANTATTIRNCINKGDITVTNKGTSTVRHFAGGIIGIVKGCSVGVVYVYNSINNASVNAPTTSTGNYSSSGGIIGGSDGNDYYQVIKSVNLSSSLTGKTKKGIVGYPDATNNANGVKFENNIFNSDNSITDTNGTGKTTANLKVASTYSSYGKFSTDHDPFDVVVDGGFDTYPYLDNVWIITEGSFPELYWSKQADCSHPNISSDPDDAIDSLEPNCTATGYMKFKCPDCQYIQTVEIPVNPEAHDFDINPEVVVPSTCSVKGTKTKTCIYCNKEQVTEIETLAPHDFQYIPAQKKLVCTVCSAEQTTVGGDCSYTGSSVEWSLDLTTGVFTLSGTGDTNDYPNGTAPFEQYKSAITSVVIGENISGIGEEFFAGCASIQSVTLEENITYIGQKAFANCYSLETVTVKCKEFEDGCITTDIIEDSPMAKVQTYCDAVVGEDSLYSALYNEGVLVESLGGHDMIAATCEEASHCSVCDYHSGSPKEHSWAETPTQCSSTQHVIVCTVCSAEKPDSKQNHSGGTATCTAKAVCTACGAAYGDTLTHNYQLTKYETYHRYECTLCHDFYGQTNHTGGLATCTLQPVCEVCGQSYSTANGHSYTVLKKDASQHWYVCENCGDEKPSTPRVNHSGGEATCTRQKACTVCGTLYGEVDTSNHKNFSTGETYPTYLVGKEDAKCGVAGYSGDEYCYACNGAVAGKQGHTISALTHTGGTATCTSKAVCILCNQEYGNKADHVFEEAWSFDKTNNKHYHKCSNPSCEEISGLASCNDGQNGATATCKAKAVCATCSNAYGDKNPDNHINDTVVKNQSDASCTQAGYTGDTICKGCGETLQEGEVIQKEDHVGGIATCITKAVCDNCHQEYGAVDKTNHSNYPTEFKNAQASTCTVKGTTGEEYCKKCGTKVGDGEELDYAPHTGGVATCKAKAVCTVCLQEYGEVDLENHVTDEPITINAKTATCTENGYTGDKVCAGCQHLIQAGSEIYTQGHIYLDTAGSNTECIWVGGQCKNCDSAKATINLRAVYSNMVPVADKDLYIGTKSVKTDSDGNVTLPELVNDDGKATVTTADGSYKIEIEINSDGTPAITIIANEAPTTPTQPDDPTDPDKPSDDNTKRTGFLGFIDWLVAFIKYILSKIGINVG